MVKFSNAALDATFGALADPTRRAILAQLALGETSVSRLAAQFDISLPGVTKHLRVLEHARLLSTEKTGRVRHCRLEPGQLRTAAEWIAFYRQFWEEQFDALEQYLKETEQEESTWQSSQRNPKARSSSSAPSRRRPNGSSKR